MKLKFSDAERKTMIRGRFWTRVVLVLIVFFVSFYATVCLVGDVKIPRVMSLTDLHKCPACYGISLCPELYSNQIIFENYRWDSILFNVKNIYHGYTRSNRKVILKKLAHDWELTHFDSKLCERWNLNPNCKVFDLLNMTNINERIEELVTYNVSETKPRKGLVFCPYPFGIHDFITPVFVNSKTETNHKSDLINVWTMLSINPEPIVLQNIPKSKGWHVPAYGGVCGRLEVVADEGEPLTQLVNIPWQRKLVIAKHLMDAAMDFTFKHDRFRFYLMDWSTDNIVVDANNKVTIVDLEDIIILDKHISPKSDVPNWYQRYAKENIEANAFSIDNLCRHHLSDHNIFSVCHILGGDDGPLLHPVPEDFKPWPHLSGLLQGCLKGPDRFKTGTLLRHYLSELVSKEHGAVS